MERARELAAWRPGAALTLAGVLLVAVNLRAAIAALGPLVPYVRADLHIGRGTAGLLTTVPVLCFGVLSSLAVLLGRRIGASARCCWPCSGSPRAAPSGCCPRWAGCSPAPP